MGLKKYIRKYKNYETKELARRAAKKRKLRGYKELKRKPITAKKIKKSLKGKKFSKERFTKAIGNPYGVKLSKRTVKVKKFY